MLDLPLTDAGFDWVTGLAFLWIGGAVWVTAVATHLRLPEWRWFALALATGPAAWLAAFLRLRRARTHRRDPADPAGSSGAAAEP